MYANDDIEKGLIDVLPAAGKCLYFLLSTSPKIFFCVDNRKCRTRSGESARRVLLFLHIILNSLYYFSSEVLDNLNP